MQGAVTDAGGPQAPDTRLHLDLAGRDPDEGMTDIAGPVPGEIGAVITLDEIVLHGWDLARATGQAYDCDDATAEACMAFVGGFDEAFRAIGDWHQAQPPY